MVLFSSLDEVSVAWVARVLLQLGSRRSRTRPPKQWEGPGVGINPLPLLDL